MSTRFRFGVEQGAVRSTVFFMRSVDTFQRLTNNRLFSFLFCCIPSGLGYSPTMKTKLTPAQKAALKAYNFANAQEDRYLGSVFVTPAGQREKEANTQAAYAACKALGMTHEHGL
jgi:hypothetical protein